MTDRNKSRAPQASSQAPPLPLELVPDGNHRPRRACSRQEGKKFQEREADVRAGQDSIFCKLGIFGTFPKISENFRKFGKFRN